MTPRTKAYGAAILFALIIGFSFLFVKVSLLFASPLDTLAHRFSLSFLGASLPLACRRVRLQVAWRQSWPILPLALLYPVLFFAFQAFGLVHTSSSEAGILQAVTPIFTLLLATFFLKERSTGRQRLAILLSVLGVVYLFAMKGCSFTGASTAGAALLLLSSLAAAGYNVLARRLTRQYPLFDLTYLITAVGFAAFNGAALVQHVRAGSLESFFAPFAQGEFVLAIAYLGLLSSLGTAFLSNYALSQLEASQMSVFGNLATVIAMFAGVAVLQETLQPFHWLGALLVLAGVLGANFFGRR